MVELKFDSTTIDTASLHWGNAIVTNDVAASDVSDTNGNLLFYCNGGQVGDSATNIMENGDTLMDPLIYSSFQGSFTEPQTNIILPRSGNTFYLFYYSESDSLYASGTIDEPDRLYYAIVDMNQNGGLGKVVSKKNVAYEGLFGDCRLTACRHANGRDWWLVNQGLNDDEYFIFRITSDSVYPPKVQHIGPGTFNLDNDGAQSTFSPDGSKFVTSCREGPVCIMDFDRCSGTFSNPDSFDVVLDTFSYNGQPMGIAIGATGCCFSASGRFVYITNTYEIWQYDTWVPNVDSSAVMVGRWDTAGRNGGFLYFWQMELMPNGQIIIDDYQGGCDSFHIIDSPDVKGLGCHFVFGDFPTATLNAGALPNMINYRLGGDGVCDTLSGLSGTQAGMLRARLYPNPATDMTQLDLYTRDLNEPLSFVLYDMLGEEIMVQNIPLYEIQISRKGVAPGVYTWQVQNAAGQNRATGKLVWE